MKLISRPHYLSQLAGVINTPDIKIVTGIRRSGKSKLLSAFAHHIRQTQPSANIIEIDLTKLRFEALKEYHALNDYVEDHYIDGVNNYLMIDEVQLCQGFEFAINSLHSEEKYDIYLTGSNAFLLSSDLATPAGSLSFPPPSFHPKTTPLALKEWWGVGISYKKQRRWR